MAIEDKLNPSETCSSSNFVDITFRQFGSRSIETHHYKKSITNRVRLKPWNSYNRLVHPSVDDMDRAALYFHKKFDLELIGNLRLHFLWVKHAIVGIPEKTDL